MKKLVAVLTGALSVLLSSGVAQARTTFPHVNDNYDISDPAAWGVDTIPSDEMNFNDVSAVYFNSRDVTFKSVQQIQSSAQDIVFRMSPSYLVTVTLNFSPYYANTKQTFDGGRWSIGGTFTATKKDGVMLFTNGVVVTATSFQAANATSGGKVIVTGSSELHFNRGDSFGTAQNSIFTVSDGAQVTWKDGYFQPWGKGSANNLFLVTGVGSTANCEDKSTPPKIADTNSVFNVLRVEKGATMWVGGGAFGQDVGAVSNRIEVVDTGSKIEFKGALKVNNVEGSFANDVLIANGGEIALTAGTADFNIGGSGHSTVIVSNATFRAAKFCIGTDVTSTGNLFRVYGKSSVLETPHRTDQFFPIFSKGGNNRFELDNADWTSPLGQVGTGYTYGNESCGNTVAFLNGSTVSLVTFSVGYNAGAGDDNKLVVSGGSTLTLTETSATKDVNVLTVGGARNTVVVSNATVSADNDFACVSVGYTAPGASTVGTGNGIVLQGATPRVSAANGTIRAQNASRFVFEIPAEGYADVPLTASKIRFEDDTVIDVSCEAFQKALRSRATVVLARATTSLNVSQAVLDAANEKLLPLKRELKIDGTDLVLKVRPTDVGLVIILR